MRSRIATGIIVAGVFLAMLTPMLMLPGNEARIDRFLAVRTRVLNTLNKPPAPPEGLSRHGEGNAPEWDPSSPGDTELKRISRTTGWWRQATQQITYLLAEGQVRSGNADSLTESLLRVETAGLAKAGLRPLTSGRPRCGADVHSAAAVQVWSDPDHFLTVIVQATVLGGAREAHVSKHVVEQFTRQP